MTIFNKSHYATTKGAVREKKCSPCNRHEEREKERDREEREKETEKGEREREREKKRGQKFVAKSTHTLVFCGISERSLIFSGVPALISSTFSLLEFARSSKKKINLFYCARRSPSGLWWSVTNQSPGDRPMANNTNSKVKSNVEKKRRNFQQLKPPDKNSLVRV